MGKRVLLFIMMFAIVGLLSAYGTEVVLRPAQGTYSPDVSELIGPVDLFEDTIRYDDFSANSYVLTNALYYVCVRYTPLLDFELQAVYLGIGFRTVSNTYDVWVTGDNGGVPDPNNIIEMQTGLTPAAGYTHVDFDTLHTFPAGTDFHIVWGPADATLYSSLIGFAGLLDQSADNLLRSYYANTFPSSSFGYLYGYDWRTRAIGTYAGGTIVDMRVNYVDNQELKYFLCEGDQVTFRAQVENMGNDNVASYDVKWVVRNAAGVLSDSVQATYTNIAPGGVAVVTAPSAWTGTTADEYIVAATVIAAGDVEPANNVDYLEQQVYDPNISTLLDYIVPNYQVNLVLDPNEGRAMEYTACQYPIQITHLEVEGSAAGNAVIRIYGDDGMDAPSGVLFDSTIALAAGMNTIAVVPPVTVSDGPFYVAYIYADATTPNLPLDGPPSASGTPTMDVNWQTADGGATWTLTGSAGDHPLSARISLFGGVIHDISMDYLTFAGFFVPTNTSIGHQVQVRNNGSAADTFNVTLTIEDTTFARSVVFTQTLPVVDLAVGDSTLLTFSSYNYASVGEYIITAEAVVPGDVTPSDNMIQAETQVCTYPSRLTYDDGTFENGWAFNTAGYFWGARFDPPIYPCKITGMRLYFTSFPATYDDARMKIYAQDGATVRYNYLDTSIDVGWNIYTVSPVVPVVSGFFYAGTEWVTAYPNAPFLGTDSDPPISYMARQLISGIWYYDVEEAGVRVTVDAARVNNLVIRKTGGTDNVNINLSWTFPGITGETWYFIYKSNTATGTYALVDSVAHPTQTWNDSNVPGVKKFYYVTFGDASGSRASTLPGEYLWSPFEITASRTDAIEPGVRPFAGEKIRQAAHQ